MHKQTELIDTDERTPRPTVYNAKEYKVVAMRDCFLDYDAACLDSPEKVEEYWRQECTKHPAFSMECESFFVVLLNTRRRVKGHVLVSTGTLDTILVHPREVFRPAVIAAASAIVLIHHHPSGDPSPSEADIKVTRDLVKAGQLLKIDVLDHVIVGAASSTRPRSSLRELGYFYN